MNEEKLLGIVLGSFIIGLMVGVLGAGEGMAYRRMCEQTFKVAIKAKGE